VVPDVALAIRLQELPALPRSRETFQEDDEEREREPQPRGAQRYDLARHHQRHDDGLRIAHVAVGSTDDEFRRRVERERPGRECPFLGRADPFVTDLQSQLGDR
jgi:hypothetical protein